MKKILFLVTVLTQLYYVNGEDWTSFRGPTGMGVTEQKITTSWNKGSILWKKSIPGEGQSSVVEASNKIFVTASENSGNKRSLLCFSKDTGKLVWQKTIIYKGEESSHRMNGWCTPTPATEGNRVVAFLGNCMRCFDTDGKKIWNYNGDFQLGCGRIFHNYQRYYLSKLRLMGPSRLIAVAWKPERFYGIHHVLKDERRVEYTSNNIKWKKAVGSKWGIRGAWVRSIKRK